MNSNDLRPWQARKVRERLEGALGYLTRLKRRMELRGFPPNDPLYLATAEAQDTLQALLGNKVYQCWRAALLPSSIALPPHPAFTR